MFPVRGYSYICPKIEHLDEWKRNSVRLRISSFRSSIWQCLQMWAMSMVMGKIAKEAIELCIKGQLRSRFLKQRNWRLTQLHYQRFAFTTALLGQSILSLKGEKRWSSVQPARTTVETCVKPAKSDVKNLRVCLFPELFTAPQERKESKHDFVLRAMDMRQKILFACKEAGSGVSYGEQQVQQLFLQTVSTGLENDIIRQELKPFIVVDGLDGALLEALTTVAVRHEAELRQKLSWKVENPAITAP